MPRHRSEYRNTRHTADALSVELQAAKAIGASVSEVQDLELLIYNAGRPKGTPPVPGAHQARNRQAQRRYHRDGGRRASLCPAAGDYASGWADGLVHQVTAVMADMAVSDVPGQARHTAPVRYLARADAPAVQMMATSPGPSPGEVLYHAAWDALEADSWERLEAALRAYEASAPP